MIFQSLSVYNFGPFKGLHDIELSPNKNAPIILFGALNGSGKTTLFDSIQLALFGKYIKAAGKFTGGYEKYLRSLINRDSVEENDTYIQLSFQVEIENETKDITIERQWSHDKRVKENCSIFIEGVHDENLSKRAYEFIQDFISPELSNLFFFDGEKIESLADPEKSKFIISQGINDLLGVNSIDSLIKTLTVVERRKAAKLAESQEEVSLIEEQQKIQLLDKNLKSINEKISDVEHGIHQKETEILEHNKVMNASGAQLFKKRDEYKNLLNINAQKSSNIETRIQDHLAGDLPLLLVKDLMREMLEIQKNSDSFTIQTADIVKKEIKNFIKVNNIKFDNNNSEDIVQKYFQSIDDNINKYPFLAEDPTILDEDQVIHIENLNKELIKETQEVADEKNEIEKNLAAIPENNKVSDLISVEKKYSNELLELKVKYNLLNNELIEIEKQLDNTNKILDQKIEVISENESISELDRNIIITSKKSRKTLQDFKLKLTHKHIDKINDQITECFNKVHRKGSANTSFKINPQDFSISMYIDDEEFNISMMSSGERQLLAISILWSLSILANKDMPILIDTPLARLDSKHRENLLKEYFPRSSHQVLIFSTDEEIDNKYYPLIESSVSHKYLIEFDKKTSLSSIAKGYFKEVINT